MTFRNFKGGTTPCPKCEYINKPEEGHINKNDDLVLRYICVNCDQKYERRKLGPQFSVVPLHFFRKPKIT